MNTYVLENAVAYNLNILNHVGCTTVRTSGDPDSYNYF